MGFALLIISTKDVDFGRVGIRESPLLVLRISEDVGRGISRDFSPYFKEISREIFHPPREKFLSGRIVLIFIPRSFLKSEKNI